MSNFISNYNYKYLDPQDSAIDDLRARIAATGRNQQTITYTELVVGIVFRLKSGKAHQISQWNEFDRALIGEYLGYLSEESQEQAGFMASALAVSADKNRPSAPFFSLAREWGKFQKKGANAEDDFWLAELAKAYAYYK